MGGDFRSRAIHRRDFVFAVRFQARRDLGEVT
jgi:hypothetical protein